MTFFCNGYKLIIGTTYMVNFTLRGTEKMPIFPGFVEDVPVATINGRLKVPIAHATALPVT